MKKYLIGLLLALTFVPAISAELVARQGSDAVVITDDRCPSKIKEIAAKQGIPAEELKKLRLALAQIQGQSYAGCYVNIGDTVAVIYEDGDIGMIPRSVFKPFKSV